jgi:DNA (cytosine-5)-methyltransferase 1
VWENVPGALSSAKGEDFRAILETLCGIESLGVSVPRPPRGKWACAGEILGDGFSLAWRVLDAQYFGVPQHRRRIFLVCDFGGARAGEVLFEREGLPRDTAPRKSKREKNPADSASGFGMAGFNGWRSVTGSLEYSEELAPCINASMPPNIVNKLRAVEPRIARTLTALSGTDNGGGRRPGGLIPADVHPETAGTLCASGAGLSRPAGMASETNLCVAYKNPVCAPQSNMIGREDKNENTGFTLKKYILRRLTPRECERAMGLPDDWTRYDASGKELADTPRYGMIGNGVAIPCVEYVMRGIADIENCKEEPS